MSVLKKIWKFISSMRFAIILLVVLAVACSAGSFIQQGQTYAWYAQAYSERTAGLIIALGLDDAFHSWWFVLITAFLCQNLLLCNLLRLPQLIRRTKAHRKPPNAPAAGGKVSATVSDPAAVFRRLRMPPASKAGPSSDALLFSSKNAAGLWGAWVCHLGVMLLILGFSLGQMTQQVYSVYGVPGQSREIGDTPYVLTIDDFRIDLREDDTVDQYTTEITVANTAGDHIDEQSGTISVNHPATLYGMKFFQNSTGWAATIDIQKDGDALQRDVLCVGEFAPVADKPELVIYLNAFYPDYVLTASGPMSASSALENPAYLYSVYYDGRMIGMNALMADEAITIDEYKVRFSDPQSYTLIQIKRDSFTWLALIGGLVTLLGLFLALYIQPARVWAMRGDDGLWSVCGECRKGGALFRERFAAAVRSAEGSMLTPKTAAGAASNDHGRDQSDASS
ncbi:MAG: cytochrome c biogenesis protein ResB [Clostridia bacterium]|nr:cytochrome c biogenesis protein ResB [Clostridia bacterium]